MILLPMVYSCVYICVPPRVCVCVCVCVCSCVCLCMYMCVYIYIYSRRCLWNHRTVNETTELLKKRFPNRQLCLCPCASSMAFGCGMTAIRECTCDSSCVFVTDGMYLCLMVYFRDWWCIFVPYGIVYICDLLYTFVAYGICLWHRHVYICAWWY
jgi:hypothetical protein